MKVYNRQRYHDDDDEDKRKSYKENCMKKLFLLKMRRK